MMFCFVFGSFGIGVRWESLRVVFLDIPRGRVGKVEVSNSRKRGIDRLYYECKGAVMLMYVPR